MSRQVFQKLSAHLLVGATTFGCGLGFYRVSHRNNPSPPILERRAEPAPVANQTSIVPIEMKTYPAAVTATEVVLQPHLVAISPYEIKRLVDEHNRLAATDDSEPFDLGSIWEQLGIENDEGEFKNCERDCRVTITDFSHALRKSKLVVVAGPLSNRYLIFQLTANRIWRIIGFTDFSVRWTEPTYRIVSAGGERWLAIEGISGHGSGFGSTSVFWYKASETGLALELSYQSSVFLSGDYLRIQRDTKMLSTVSSGEITTVILKSSTSYSAYTDSDSEIRLWTAERRTTFRKGPGMQEFQFDPFQSEMDEKLLLPQNEEDLSQAEFLKYNYPELVRLALGNDSRRREWLRKYLESSDETTESQSLGSALDRHQK
jgi:hypothetical protein